MPENPLELASRDPTGPPGRPGSPQWNGRDSNRGKPSSEQSDIDKWGKPEGIVLNFAGRSELNGVVFDNVYEGGIVAASGERAKRNNVFQGEHKLATPDRPYYALKN